MIDDDKVTAFQLAIQADDKEGLQRLLEPHTADEITELQLFADHTLLMFACQYSTPEVVEVLQHKGARVHELEWSVNNEVKSALRNERHAPEILAQVLGMIPQELLEVMVESDWDPEEMEQGRAESPLQMALKLKDKACLKLLEASVKGS